MTAHDRPYGQRVIGSSSAPGGSAGPRRDSRRADILAAFTRSVAERGYDGTNFGDLALELGMSPVEVRRKNFYEPFDEPTTTPRACSAQVRAHGHELPATVRASGTGTLEVELPEGVRGLAPGQSVVLYDGTRVIAQATVSRTWR